MCPTKLGELWTPYRPGRGAETADAKRAHGAVIDAAELLGVQPRDLDHAIWRHESGRSVRR